MKSIDFMLTQLCYLPKVPTQSPKQYVTGSAKPSMLA